MSVTSAWMRSTIVPNGPATSAQPGVAGVVGPAGAGWGGPARGMSGPPGGERAADRANRPAPPAQAGAGFGAPNRPAPRLIGGWSLSENPGGGHRPGFL